MEFQKEIDTEKSTVRSYLNERLASDDQILSRLPGIVSKLAVEIEESDDERSIEQWCKAIVSFRTGEIKARVDTVYLNSLAQHQSSGHSETSNVELNGRKAALQTEMEELHSEIASVAEMVVEHELRKPMDEMKDRKDREVTQARGAWLNYVSLPLFYTLRITNICRSSQHLTTWASDSTPSTTAQKTSTASNRLSHMLTMKHPSACQMYTLRDQHHHDEELHLNLCRPSHLWSNLIPRKL